VRETGFRRFLGLPAKQAERPTLTQLAEDPTTPPAPFAPLSRRAATEVRPPASPVSKAAQKLPEIQKEVARPRDRTPAYVWRSQASGDARTLWADYVGDGRPF
jgi:hypothetical protein